VKTVIFSQSGGVGTILLTNPPKNSIDRRFVTDLLAAVHDASEAAIRVLIVAADGPNFSAGGDVAEWQDKDRNWFRTFIAEANQAYEAIEALEIPTIAAVQGKIVSGGYELVLHCDVIVASDDAVFQWVESTCAMAPFAGGLQRLADRLGRNRAFEHLLFATPIDGSQAREWGLVYQVVAGNKLRSTVEGIAQRLSVGGTRLRFNAVAPESLGRRRGPGCRSAPSRLDDELIRYGRCPTRLP
jgi:enoyl-CoA hydratase/carnithine racemase